MNQYNYDHQRALTNCLRIINSTEHTLLLNTWDLSRWNGTRTDNLRVIEALSKQNLSGAAKVMKQSAGLQGLRMAVLLNAARKNIELHDSQCNDVLITPSLQDVSEMLDLLNDWMVEQPKDRHERVVIADLYHFMSHMLSYLVSRDSIENGLGFPLLDKTLEQMVSREVEAFFVYGQPNTLLYSARLLMSISAPDSYNVVKCSHDRLEVTLDDKAETSDHSLKVITL